MTVQQVAIVGANGFIARQLIGRLETERSINLHLFGRSAGVRGKNQVKPFRYDNEGQLAADFGAMDVIYYLISETIPSTSWEDPMIEIEKNLVPFTKFLNCVSRHKVRKIAFISSAGTVYGATTGKVPEDFDKKPFAPYGIVKLTMENLLHHYQVKYGLQYDVFRVSNVYGDGQNTAKGLGIINTFLEGIIRENKVTVFGDGSSTRNYIYVKDVAALLSLSVHTMGSDIYNVSSFSTLSINELVQVMKQAVETPFEVVYKEGRQSDNSYIDLDNSKILRLFPGFMFTNIGEGIRKTYAALKNQQIKNQD